MCSVSISQAIFIKYVCFQIYAIFYSVSASGEILTPPFVLVLSHQAVSQITPSFIQLYYRREIFIEYFVFINHAPIYSVSISQAIFIKHVCFQNYAIFGAVSKSATILFEYNCLKNHTSFCLVCLL